MQTFLITGSGFSSIGPDLQVWFGDTIITKMWKTGPGEAIVQAETQSGAVVLSQAKTTFKE